MSFSSALVHGDVKRRDKAIGLAVSLQTVTMAVKNILVSGSAFLLSINNILNTGLFLVIGAIYLWGFRYVHRRMKISSIVILTVSAALICLSALLFNENIPFIKELLPRVIVYGFIGFLYISSMNDFGYLLNYLVKFSYIIILASIVSTYMLMRSAGAGYLDSQYRMTLSYFTSIGVVFLLYKYARDQMKIDLLIIATGMFVIIAFGSRSDLLSTFSYAILCFIRHPRIRASTVNRLLLLLAIGLLLVPNHHYMTNKFNEILIDQGIYSRTLNLFTSGRIMEPSGRDVIHDIVLNEFYERPFTGIGMGGSHVLTGTGTHGMYIEIFTSFGLIIGSIVFVFLFYTLAKGFKASRGKAARELILIYGCLVIPRGFIGGGLWTNYELWWLLGLCVSVIANVNMNVEHHQA